MSYNLNNNINIEITDDAKAVFGCYWSSYDEFYTDFSKWQNKYNQPLVVGRSGLLKPANNTIK